MAKALEDVLSGTGPDGIALACPRFGIVCVLPGERVRRQRRRGREEEEEKKIEKNRRQKYFCTRETIILKKVSPHLTTAKWTTTTMCMLVWTPHDPVINCACCSKMTWI